MYTSPNTTGAVKARQNVERAIVRALVNELLAQGFRLTVWNGGDTPECSKEIDFAPVWNALGETDEDELVAAKGIKGQPDYICLKFWLVYGNDGFDVLSDYTVSAEPFIPLTLAVIKAHGGA